MLDEGAIDAVVISELNGLSVAAAMGMSDRIHAASRPINIETLHMIIAKTHPNARTVLYYINSSLARLKETGAYDAITAKHLDQFWGVTSTIAGQASTGDARKPETSATTPAAASQTPPVRTGERETAPQQKSAPPAKKPGDGKTTGQP